MYKSGLIVIKITGFLSLFWCPLQTSTTWTASYCRVLYVYVCFTGFRPRSKLFQQHCSGTSWGEEIRM